MSRTLTIAGLALTVLGALALAFDDLRGRGYTQRRLSPGPHPSVWAGFLLIAGGSSLQIAGSATS